MNPAMWVELEGIMLNKISQPQKSKYPFSFPIFFQNRKIEYLFVQNKKEKGYWG